MKKPDAVAALAALAQDSRLDVFRLLVQAGPAGLPAGQVAAKLKLAPNTLTFHFDRLRDAGLVTVRRDGRSMIYATRFETMNALRAIPHRELLPRFANRQRRRMRAGCGLRAGVGAAASACGQGQKCGSGPSPGARFARAALSR